ncbi:hypothetical protein [Microcoleus sp. bin38.metabat.b11b12b14.051]|uniref:hypothetical protein n=1 Tax=Microcoleus sp. bin38.metabat.b11b12b14.051 TaxID=2742709 RepID=UPI0025EE85BC|nr:hypothetical protein [Microcoleus sp. bin38.metabat.b11b12b14.051]
MQVKDMTIEQLRDLIRHTVEQCLEEYFGDPDSGLEVKEEVKQKLLESLKRKQAEESGIQKELKLKLCQPVIPQPKRSILELEGLGKEIWNGIDAGEYVNQERDSWNG